MHNNIEALYIQRKETVLDTSKTTNILKKTVPACKTSNQLKRGRDICLFRQIME